MGRQFILVARPKHEIVTNGHESTDQVWAQSMPCVLRNEVTSKVR